MLRASCCFLKSRNFKWRHILLGYPFQENRINDQRCDPDLVHQALTIQDEDFFGLILRLQSNRIDEQRCILPEGRHNQSATKAKQMKPSSEASLLTWLKFVVLSWYFRCIGAFKPFLYFKQNVLNCFNLTFNCRKDMTVQVLDTIFWLFLFIGMHIVFKAVFHKNIS